MDQPPQKPRRLFAALGIVGGAVLLYFEIRQMSGGKGGEVWFWLVVAVLMIVLGLFGLFDQPRKP